MADNNPFGGLVGWFGALAKEPEKEASALAEGRTPSRRTASREGETRSPMSVNRAMSSGGQSSEGGTPIGRLKSSQGSPVVTRTPSGYPQRTPSQAQQREEVERRASRTPSEAGGGSPVHHTPRADGPTRLSSEAARRPDPFGRATSSAGFHRAPSTTAAGRDYARSIFTDKHLLAEQASQEAEDFAAQIRAAESSQQNNKLADRSSRFHVAQPVEAPALVMNQVLHHIDNAAKQRRKMEAVAAASGFVTTGLASISTIVPEYNHRIDKEDYHKLNAAAKASEKAMEKMASGILGAAMSDVKSRLKAMDADADD